MMKLRFVPAIALALIAAGALQLAPAAFGQGGGKWVTLFDGKSLNGWNQQGNANWMLANGIVQASTGNGFLVTSGTYGDFDLRVEFWVDADANSGVFIRCEDPQKVGGMTCYEVNIYDKRPDQSYRTGAIVDVAKPLAQIDTGGKWNTFEISARGPHMTITLDGKRTADGNDSKHARGVIGLQYGQGTVKFRKVEIRTY
jgi:3-keto-disaccharide hydrolase